MNSFKNVIVIMCLSALFFQVFAEKQELRDDIDGAVDGLLHFDQVLDRIRFGFDEPAIKCLLSGNGKESGLTCHELLLYITALIRIGQGSMLEKEIQLGQKDFKNA